MKKNVTLVVLGFLMLTGLSACIKDDRYYANPDPVQQLAPNQAVLLFNTSNGWTANNYFENAPAAGTAHYGQLYNTGNVQGILIDGYVPLQNGQQLVATLTLEDWYNNPIAPGRTIRIQPVGNATQGLITLETAQGGQYYDPWYSDYGEIYVQNYDGYAIEGSFSARMYRNVDPSQIMDVRNGQFYARLR